MKFRFRFYLLTLFSLLAPPPGLAVLVDPPERIALLPDDAAQLFDALFDARRASDAAAQFEVAGHDAECVRRQESAFRDVLGLCARQLLGCFGLRQRDVAGYARCSGPLEPLRSQFLEETDSCAVRYTGRLFWEFNCYVDVVAYFLQRVLSSVRPPESAADVGRQRRLQPARTRCVGRTLLSIMEKVDDIDEAYGSC